MCVCFSHKDNLFGFFSAQIPNPYYKSELSLSRFIAHRFLPFLFGQLHLLRNALLPAFTIWNFSASAFRWLSSQSTKLPSSPGDLGLSPEPLSELMLWVHRRPLLGQENSLTHTWLKSSFPSGYDKNKVHIPPNALFAPVRGIRRISGPRYKSDSKR